MTLNTGSIISSRYEIIEKIGTGGMAKVYRAKDKKLDRFVTFKVMREDFINDDEFRARFKVEAQAAASLSNQNIVNVYDVGQEDDIHYIVMEYVDGATLKDLIKKRAPFENEEILGVAIQIGVGLAHAHDNGVIHRDIKPQNIMVTNNGNIKVMDFGIARAASSSTVTTAGNMMGSVHYFSPEQARGGYVDNKSDIYALGIVMFEMASGHLPYDGETPIAIALKHINDPLPNLKEINPELSESIIRIIGKATEKQASHRYQTISEMVNDMKRAITNATGEFVTSEEKGVEDSPTMFLQKEDLAEIERMPIDPNNDEDEDDYDDEKASEKKVIIAAIAVSLAIILVIIAIGSFVISNALEDVPKKVDTVPNLQGKTLAEAEAEIEGTGISLSPTEIYDDTVPKGVIISQDIGDDNIIYEGEIMDIVVSLGTNKFKVPDVVGKEIRDAMDVFGQEEYSMFIPDDSNFEYSDDKPQGVVIRQEPEGGEMAEVDSVIKLYVSKGPEVKDVIVPEVIGETEADAIATLEEFGLAPDVSYAESDTVPEGQVIDQTVNPGEKVSINTPVGVVVSEGKPEELETSEEAETGSEAEETTKTITIDVPPGTIPSNVNTVNVQVIKVTQSGNENYYNENVAVEDFPIQVPVTGASDADYKVSIKDINSPDIIYYYGG